MSHYFDLDPNLKHQEKVIKYEINEMNIELFTDSGVFSKNRIDEGTYLFLKVLVPLRLHGRILDLGCGYGPLGLTIGLFSPSSHITLADVNMRALDLCKKNACKLGLENRVTILHSDIYENIEGPYDSIVVNPPIRAGKEITYRMYEGAKQYLIDGGSLYVVIRRAQGAGSASKYIETVFGNVVLLDRKKGHYFYKATKSEKENL